MLEKLEKCPGDFSYITKGEKRNIRSDKLKLLRREKQSKVLFLPISVNFGWLSTLLKSKFLNFLKCIGWV